MIDSAAHDNHCAPASFDCVVGEFAGGVNHQVGIDARKFFLPARSVRRVVIIRACTLAADTDIDSVIGERQIVNRRHELNAVFGFDFLDGHGAAYRRIFASVVSEVGQNQFDNVVAFAQD